MELGQVCENSPYQTADLDPVHERSAALCMHDNIANFLLKPDIPLFCTHESRLRVLDGIRIPIAFGVSSRMLEKTAVPAEFGQRRNYALRSFRPTFRQDVRACLDLTLLPGLSKRIPVETKYADADGYWKLLSMTRYCLAYGGAFTQDLTISPQFSDVDAFREFYSHVAFGAETVITRWDSWRFWESLVAGCVTIHLDFEKYGFKLPVMPENWKHYIGLDLANLNRDIERIMDEQDRMEEIAHNGRLWAIEHYSPVAVARRFLNTMDLLYPV